MMKEKTVVFNFIRCLFFLLDYIPYLNKTGVQFLVSLAREACLGIGVSELVWGSLKPH